MNLGLSHYLVLSAVLFAISVVGIFLNRKKQGRTSRSELLAPPTSSIAAGP